MYNANSTSFKRKGHSDSKGSNNYSDFGPSFEEMQKSIDKIRAKAAHASMARYLNERYSPDEARLIMEEMSRNVDFALLMEERCKNNL